MPKNIRAVRSEFIKKVYLQAQSNGRYRRTCDEIGITRAKIP